MNSSYRFIWRFYEDKFTRSYRSFKHIEGENDTITFLSLNMKIGGLIEYVQDKEVKCLTEDQARYIYKKVELQGVINVDTIKQEIEQEKLK